MGRRGGAEDPQHAPPRSARCSPRPASTSTARPTSRCCNRSSPATRTKGSFGPDRWARTRLGKVALHHRRRPRAGPRPCGAAGLRRRRHHRGRLCATRSPAFPTRWPLPTIWPPPSSSSRTPERASWPSRPTSATAIAVRRRCRRVSTNSAGSTSSSPTPASRPMAGEDGWHDVIDVNLTGVHNTIDAAMPTDGQGRQGRIDRADQFRGRDWPVWAAPTPAPSATPPPSTAWSG